MNWKYKCLAIDISTTLHNLATKLIEITVSEWLSHPDYYRRDCGNPCGVRPSHNPIRKRFKHKWQELTPICSAECATQRNEVLKEGSITKFEFFVMVNITNYCDEEDTDLSTENILSIYNQIATVTKDRNYTSTLRPLTPPIINRFLNQQKKNLQTFKVPCQMQLEWNITKET